MHQGPILISLFMCLSIIIITLGWLKDSNFSTLLVACQIWGFCNLFTVRSTENKKWIVDFGCNKYQLPFPTLPNLSLSLSIADHSCCLETIPEKLLHRCTAFCKKCELKHERIYAGLCCKDRRNAGMHVCERLKDGRGV